MRYRSMIFPLASLALLSLFASCGGGSQTQEPSAAAPTSPASERTPGSEPDVAALPPSTGGSDHPARTLPIPGGSPGSPDALPPGHPPIDTAPAPTAAQTIAPPPPGSGSGLLALGWKVPAGWVEEPPSSNLRKAQYKVPGPGGNGECIVFYFGPGQGGDAMSNAQRWASQFKQADGSTSEQSMKTKNYQVGGIPVLEVEVAGTYAGGMTMTMAPAEDKPGYMLLGAVAQGPDSNWFFKFTGPESTVKGQRDAFEQMIKSLKQGA